MSSDFNIDNPIGLMRGRLGIYNIAGDTTTDLSGRDNLKSRLDTQGGPAQQERMILNKKRSLQKALLYSYQGADILKWGDSKATPVRALINPNKLKQDYDDKIVSVEYDHGFKPGDIFEWVGMGTRWLIYLQDLTELAYFRGDIRRCSYKIAWEDDNKVYHETYAAVKGPVETKINFIQKGGISVDNPNLSLNLLMPLTDETLEYFTRYSKFYLQTDSGIDIKKICWRVEAIDWISTPGILEVVAVEYYSNEHEDDLSNGIVGGLIVEEENPNSPEVEATIIGQAFIKPKFEYTFKYTGTEPAVWSYTSPYPIKMEEFVDADGASCVNVTWVQSYKGQFDLTCNGVVKTIIVESLF